MDRRDFLRLCTVNAIGLGAMGLRSSNAAGKVKKASRPNIVFILADDMGFGDVKCLNPDSKIPTPNMDRLASQGMTFTDAHSGSAICTPTRYGLLTGRYCWRSPMKNSVLWPWDAPLIAEDRLTVADLLKRHNYQTACIGKWHLGWDWPTTDGSQMADQLSPGVYDDKKRLEIGKKIDLTKRIPGGPITRGFDYYFGTSVPNFPPYCFIEDDRTVGFPNVEKPDSMFGSPGMMLEGWDLRKILPALETKAVEYIEDRADSKDPFFLYMPLTAPHTPIAPSKEYQGKSQAGAYGDFVNQVDAVAGSVMRALERTGQAENTLLILTSDNGSPARDGTNMNGAVNSVKRFGHYPSYIYRGRKALIWEGGHRVPFFVRWPGRVTAGSRCDQLVCLGDFMRTCADLLDEKLPDNTAEDSVSILPLLEGKTDTPVRESIIHHNHSGFFAIRRGKWKFVLAYGGHLYDMEADPSETNNLFNEKRELAQELHAELVESVQNGRSTAGRPQKNDTPVNLKFSFPVSIDHTGDFDMVLDAEIKRHSMGCEMSSPSIGYALHKLGRPMRTGYVFEFRCRSLKKQTPQNALFVFGDSPDANAMVKCGLLIGVKHLAIWRGTWDQWESGDKRNVALDANKDYDVVVEIDTKKRIVLMRVGGNELQLPLPQDIKEIRYYGYLVNDTSSAFSVARQSSLSTR